MGKISKIGLLIVKIASFPFVVMREMTKGILDQPDKTASRYWKGLSTRVLRPESYRRLKRRNRLMRKYHHKKDRDR